MRKALVHVSPEARKRAQETGRQGGKKKFALMTKEERAEYQRTLTAAATKARKERSKK